jgi:methyl coenzyme M reductase beta subunit
MRERSAEKSLTNAIATTGVVSMAAAISAAGSRASRLAFRILFFNPLLERNGWDQIRWL